MSRAPYLCLNPRTDAQTTPPLSTHLTRHPTLPNATQPCHAPNIAHPSHTHPTLPTNPYACHQTPHPTQKTYPTIPTAHTPHPSTHTPTVLTYPYATYTHNLTLTSLMPPTPNLIHKPIITKICISSNISPNAYPSNPTRIPYCGPHSCPNNTSQILFTHPCPNVPTHANKPPPPHPRPCRCMHTLHPSDRPLP